MRHMICRMFSISVWNSLKFELRMAWTNNSKHSITQISFKINNRHMFIIYSQYNLYGLSKYLELVDGMSTARQEHLSNDIEFLPIPSSNILLKFATELMVKIAKAFNVVHTVVPPCYQPRLISTPIENILAVISM